MCEVVAVDEHVQPMVPIQVVYGSTTANDEGVFVSKVTQGFADFDVKVWIIASVHRDEDRGRRNMMRKHADDHEKGIVDPIKRGIAPRFEACLL